MTWTCVECERWLDEGRPDEGKGAADAHVAGCGRCSSALAAARAIEAALVLPVSATTPAGFTNVVMRRVGSLPVAARAPVLEGPTLPWSVRANANPVIVTLVTLAAFLLWQSTTLQASAAVLASRLATLGDLTGRWLAAAIEMPTTGSLLAEPAVLLGLAVALAPLLLWVGLQLARCSEQATQRPQIRLVRPR